MAEFSVDLEEADRRRHFYFEEYGTTLRGLMDHHGMDPEKFLPYCHELDLTDMGHDVALDEALTALPGRKVIYTNATRQHGANVLGRLGIERHFEDVFDIADADYMPKPHTPSYDTFLARYGIDPKRTVMFEDTAKNLKPAADLGMGTVWLRNDRPGAQPLDADESHIHHTADELSDFLQAVLAA